MANSKKYILINLGLLIKNSILAVPRSVEAAAQQMREALCAPVTYEPGNIPDSPAEPLQERYLPPKPPIIWRFNLQEIVPQTNIQPTQTIPLISGPGNPMSGLATVTPNLDVLGGLLASIAGGNASAPNLSSISVPTAATPFSLSGLLKSNQLKKSTTKPQPYPYDKPNFPNFSQPR